MNFAEVSDGTGDLVYAYPAINRRATFSLSLWDKPRFRVNRP